MHKENFLLLTFLFLYKKGLEPAIRAKLFAHCVYQLMKKIEQKTER